MAQAKTTKKNIALTPAPVKNADKKAIKALARAEKAVDSAREAVKASSKKLRKEALALHKKTEKLAAKLAKAAQQLATEVGRANQSVLATVKSKKAAPQKSAGTVVAEDAASRTALTVPHTTVKTALSSPPRSTTPTLIELRNSAKEQKITGYSRMNKAALVAAVNSSH